MVAPDVGEEVPTRDKALAWGGIVLVVLGLLCLLVVVISKVSEVLNV